MTDVASSPMASTQETLLDELHCALAHLYDPAELRKSPLLARFGLQNRHDPLGALRHILSGAIQALRPAESVPLHADIWRIYHVLTYRYVEQMSQREVATDLGLSIRHLRRLEHEAVAVLADHLLAQYTLHAADVAAPAPAEDPADADVAAPDAIESVDSERETELAWLKESLPSEAVDLGGVVEAALRTVRPLSESAGVSLEYTVPGALPPVVAQRGGIRQALLNLLTAAIHSAPAGRVRVLVDALADGVRVSVLASSSGSPLPVGGEVLEKLEMTRRLAELSGARLRVEPAQESEAPFVATLTLTAAEQVPVLVIDDNADALRLLERYAAGTRYRLTGTRDPEQALQVANDLAPQAIILDIMLPAMDGWELLGRLREHPGLSRVPVIVCTILPQQQLALALGAAAFLRKPLTREAFLSALDQQVGRSSTESR